jgi:hypothetical protein
MANENPTDDGRTAVLQIPSSDVPFLRFLFTTARDGIRDDMAQFTSKVREPARRLREKTAYGQMVDVLDGRPVRLDRDLLDAVFRVAESIDRENEYRRVVAEHTALHGVLDQIKEVLA